MLNTRASFYLAILSLLFSALSFVPSYYLIKNGNEGSLVQIISPDDAQIDTQVQDVRVEISGAVNFPGVYTLNKDSRVADLVGMAGGFHSNVFSYYVARQVNLAAHVLDGEKLYIPFMFEQEKLTPVIESALIKLDTAGLATSVTQGSAGAATAPASAPPSLLGKVNINTATLAELDTLPGIGQTYAQKIIDSRPYDSVDKLKTLKILPDATFEKIKEMLTL